ncbi:hypothetical protein EZV61_04325 [Corallincola luteus]|uniref:GP-PDE domain-containing protein n=1 Tax=Corallincola luteus TaxID=1775177 RepID=A0ABY2APS9_9GAMM|nr:hypothetical protein EZV61_04325 [Corallincola luteus]
MREAAIQVIAHRGDCTAAPENSLASIQAALNSGCRLLEIDVQLSSDGVPVLFHDRDCKRLLRNPMPGAIADYPIATLQQWQIEEHERLPAIRAPLTLLSEVVTQLVNHPDVTLFVEVKRAALERFSYAQLFDTLMETLRPILLQSVLISFSLPFLRYARAHHGQRLGVVLGDWEWLKDRTIEQIAPEYIFCNIERVPEGECFTTQHPQWVIYEVGSEALRDDLARRGITMIESFFPAKLMAK